MGVVPGFVSASLGIRIAASISKGNFAKFSVVGMSAYQCSTQLLVEPHGKDNTYFKKIE